MVAVSPSGEIATPFNSGLMNRGWIDQNMVPHTAQVRAPPQQLDQRSRQPKIGRLRLSSKVWLQGEENGGSAALSRDALQLERARPAPAKL